MNDNSVDQNPFEPEGEIITHTEDDPGQLEELLQHLPPGGSAKIEHVGTDDPPEETASNSILYRKERVRRFVGLGLLATGSFAYGMSVGFFMDRNIPTLHTAALVSGASFIHSNNHDPSRDTKYCVTKLASIEGLFLAGFYVSKMLPGLNYQL